MDYNAMRHKIVVISGAIEEESKVTNIAKRCALLKTTLQIDIVPIKSLPLINVDHFSHHFPDSVQLLRERVQNCDGLLFIVPEFFGKVSPAFKNAFDWLAYSPDAEHPSPIRGLAACMISVGGEDGSGVQKHMLQMGEFCRLRLMSKPGLHFNVQKLDSFGKNFQYSSGKDIEDLENVLNYFSQFLGKKPKQK